MGHRILKALPCPVDSEPSPKFYTKGEPPYQKVNQIRDLQQCVSGSLNQGPCGVVRKMSSLCYMRLFWKIPEQSFHVINVAPHRLCYAMAQTLLGYLPASSWNLLGRNIQFSNIQNNSSKCMHSGQIKNIYNMKKLTYIAMD